MGKFKVFVDGQAGTTGLEIKDRLVLRTDIELLEISEANRKDVKARSSLLNEADIVFLCLPDDAAIESAALVTNPRTRIIDASTAHRTDPDWVYGLPELSKEQRSMIANSTRVANPGCHATGFALGLFPLIKAGIVQRDYPVTCHSLSGYSGGGKGLIEQYQTGTRVGLNSPSHYALGLMHKHIPEMHQVTGLTYPPHFTPVVGNFYRGLTVGIPLLGRLTSGGAGAKEIHAALEEHYAAEHFVKVKPFESDSNLEGGFFNPESCNNTNMAEVFVFGHAEQALVLVRLDNLGKGASGAAIQNMNILLGIDERTGLE